MSLVALCTPRTPAPALPRPDEVVAPHDVAAVRERAARHLCPDELLAQSLVDVLRGSRDLPVAGPQTLKEAALVQVAKQQLQPSTAPDKHLRRAEHVSLQEAAAVQLSPMLPERGENQVDELFLVLIQERGRQEVEVPGPLLCHVVDAALLPVKDPAEPQGAVLAVPHEVRVICHEVIVAKGAHGAVGAQRLHDRGHVARELALAPEEPGWDAPCHPPSIHLCPAQGALRRVPQASEPCGELRHEPDLPVRLREAG
mmetsp:Transcript_19788/g.55815  ORF Transcript_19788/g.55815 Transcript_19788/m.55815 type:complete len:256 (+) Transcript_19788:21-788(+)